MMAMDMLMLMVGIVLAFIAWTHTSNQIWKIQDSKVKHRIYFILLSVWIYWILLNEPLASPDFSKSLPLSALGVSISLPLNIIENFNASLVFLMFLIPLTHVLVVETAVGGWDIINRAIRYIKPDVHGWRPRIWQRYSRERSRGLMLEAMKYAIAPAFYFGSASILVLRAFWVCCPPANSFFLYLVPFLVVSWGIGWFYSHFDVSIPFLIYRVPPAFRKFRELIKALRTKLYIQEKSR